MRFELLEELQNIDVIAVGNKIHDIKRLRKFYGSGRWRKMKGTALIRLEQGAEVMAELHWYEAHGVGKREMKIKQILGTIE